MAIENTIKLLILVHLKLRFWDNQSGTGLFKNSVYVTFIMTNEKKVQTPKFDRFTPGLIGLKHLVGIREGVQNNLGVLLVFKGVQNN